MAGGAVGYCGECVMPTGDESRDLEYELVFPVAAAREFLRDDFEMLGCTKVVGGKDLHFIVHESEFREILGSLLLVR